MHRTTAEQVTEKVHDPLLAALLVGKATVAAERGVPLRLAGTTLLPDRLVDPGGLVTILGNLVDNALDAAAGSTAPLVEVELRAEGRTAVLRVRDSGPGVPAARREEIFTEGWSTKQPRPTASAGWASPSYAASRSGRAAAPGPVKQRTEGRSSPSYSRRPCVNETPMPTTTPTPSTTEVHGRSTSWSWTTTSCRRDQREVRGKVPGFRVRPRRTFGRRGPGRAGRAAPVDLVLLDHYLPDETASNWSSACASAATAPT